MKIYSVGGSVRDKLLGLNPTDLDYVMVLKNIEGLTPEDGFKIMTNYMENEGFKIFLSIPEMYVIRAKFPESSKSKNLVADFSLARKEVGYEPNTRRPILELGNLYDDLLRRDFTVNAIAEDENGNIIDYFKGLEHLNDKILVTPQPTLITFNDDPLRLLRAVRFHITKGFMITEEIKGAMKNYEILDKLRLVVSQERIREELLKMFKHDTIATIKVLTRYDLLEICFGRDMWLEPTFKKVK